MATPLRYWCSIDGLEMDMTELFGGRREHYPSPLQVLETAPVGFELEIQNDAPATCANGHRWAVGMKLEFRREA